MTAAVVLVKFCKLIWATLPLEPGWGAEQRRRLSACPAHRCRDQFTRRLLAFAALPFLLLQPIHVEVLHRFDPVLDGPARSEITSIDAYMRGMADRFRPPFGKRVIGCARQCILSAP